MAPNSSALPETRSATRPQQLLGIGKHLRQAGECSVPLEHNELGLVQPPEFVQAARARHLKNARKTGGQQPLHVQLGRSDQITTLSGDGIEMQIHPGGGHAQRRLDFQEMLARKIVAHGSEGARARLQMAPHAVPREAREVAITARLGARGLLDHECVA